MVRIVSVKARQVLDSRGNPTVWAEIATPKGSFSSIVPSGASTGSHEALEMRDGGMAYGGKGVMNAVRNVNETISRRLAGKDFCSQSEFDEFLIALDGTANKSMLGANAMLAVSMSFCRAMAGSENMELYEYLGKISGTKAFVLPIPQLNVMNGGKHAGRENDIQEHMYMPVHFSSFSQGLQAGVETYHALKAMLKKKLGEQAMLLGDEGGFAPKIDDVESRLELMLGAVEQAGYKGKIKIALDCASSEFFKDGSYNIGGKAYSAGDLVDYYSSLVDKFGIISIEDGLSEDDWNGWRMLTSKLGKKIRVVGDDLLVTNVDRMKAAIERRACNALLLKVNQIGTLTESLNAFQLASRNGWQTIVSHRSGESEDAFIADLVAGIAAGQSKFGAPARSERTAKYNRLLAIEEKLSESGKARYAGSGA